MIVTATIVENWIASAYQLAKSGTDTCLKIKISVNFIFLHFVHSPIKHSRTSVFQSLFGSKMAITVTFNRSPKWCGFFWSLKSWLFETFKTFGQKLKFGWKFLNILPEQAVGVQILADLLAAGGCCPWGKERPIVRVRDGACNDRWTVVWLLRSWIVRSEKLRLTRNFWKVYQVEL